MPGIQRLQTTALHIVASCPELLKLPARLDGAWLHYINCAARDFAPVRSLGAVCACYERRSSVLDRSCSVRSLATHFLLTQCEAAAQPDCRPQPLPLAANATAASTVTDTADIHGVATTTGTLTLSTVELYCGPQCGDGMLSMKGCRRKLKVEKLVS